MRLGKYFSLQEMTVSESAARRGVPNVPGNSEIQNLRNLVVNILDPLREKIGPIIVTSGYRSPVVNRIVKGSLTSQHVTGHAADIICPNIPSPHVVAIIIDLKLPFDQLIEEFGQWTHVSYSPRKRKEVLRARSINGKTVYTRIG